MVEAHPNYLFRFLTISEIKYCESKRHFAEPAAARIAAKKACLSLFRIPSGQWKQWMLQIKIEKTDTGQPFVKLSSDLKQRAGIKKNQKILLSLAHERELAIAWVALAEAETHAA